MPLITHSFLQIIYFCIILVLFFLFCPMSSPACSCTWTIVLSSPRDTWVSTVDPPGPAQPPLMGGCTYLRCYRWSSTVWCQLLCSVRQTWDTQVSKTCVCAVWHITASYVYTHHDSSCALELTVSRFIVSKRWQTAGSCKQSCIWDGKTLFSAPWPVAALQGILSSLCTSAHQPTPSALYVWALASLPVPSRQTDCWTDPQGLAPMY